MTARRAAFAAAVLVHLAVLYAPSAPAAPAAGDLDKVVHAAAFAAVAWTGRLAGLPALPLALALGGHALVSEALQSALLPGRSGEWSDVAADVAGTLLGAVVRLPPSRRDIMDA